MSLQLEIEKMFVQESERVKSVELHPTEPWILASLYSGMVQILDYQSKSIEKSFKVAESPVRSAKFITRKSWIIAGADDGFIRVYDYNSSEEIREFQAHKDYIRYVVVHPALPYVLSSSDDGTIKIFNWEDDWKCMQVFKKHANYVMAVALSPKEPNCFASASLDGTIKMWNFDSSIPKFVLDEESKGINCVDYFMDGENLYIISGSDDYSAKVWDCETKKCVKKLEGHTNNVSAVSVHKELPFILTASEDECLCVWHSTNHRLERKLDLGLGRIWTIGTLKGSDKIVLGCDKGTIMIKITIAA